MTDLGHVSTFWQAAGLRLTAVAASRVEGFIELGPEHHQPFGLVHGGVYCSAVETAASVGAFEAVRDRGLGVVGVTNSTDFVRAVRQGRVDVVAVPVHQGRTHQLWEVTITDQQARLVATGRVRLQHIEPRP